MKSFFRNIHLYLGLAAGLVIMSCCFSGAILVFEKELQEGLNKSRYFVQERGRRVPLEQLVANVQSKYPAGVIGSIKIYPDSSRSIEVLVSIPEKRTDKQADNATKEAGGKDKRDAPGVAKDSSSLQTAATGDKQISTEKRLPIASSAARTTYTAFVNPYSGSIIELYNYRETLYFKMFSLHRWLLGNDGGIGKTITGTATFIFLFILLTGIILWWPRNRAILKQRLKIKTDASFKRINHDLHIVLGFYSAIFLFVFAFTALAFSFRWVNRAIYTVTNSSTKFPDHPRSVYQLNKKRISYDSAFSVLSQVAGNAQLYALRAPADSTGIFLATVLPAGAHETAADTYYIDQYSGEVIGNLKFNNLNPGQRIKSTFKPIHVGSIYGLPSKIIAFIVCVLGVTFPITGTIIWINRLRKKKTKQPAGSKRQAVSEEDVLDEL